MTKTQAPKVNRLGLKEEISSKRSHCGKFFLITNSVAFGTKKHCFGRVLSMAARMTLQHIFNSNKCPGLANMYADNFLARHFLEWVENHRTSPIGRYYSSRIGAVVV